MPCRIRGLITPYSRSTIRLTDDDDRRDQQDAALHDRVVARLRSPRPATCRCRARRRSSRSGSRRPAACRPAARSTVTTGISALRNAWTTITRAARQRPWRARCARSPRAAPRASPSASCRAITASGIVPSAIAGRIRCDSADAERALVAGEQRVDQHEAGDAAGCRTGWRCGPRPASSRGRPRRSGSAAGAHQKIGIE